MSQHSVLNLERLERHVQSPAFLQECAMHSKQIDKDSVSNDGDSGYVSDHSLMEDDSGSTFSSGSSVESSRYAVSNLEARFYYSGLRGPKRRGPKLIFRTSKDAFTPPSWSDEYPRLKQVLPVNEHQKLGKNNLWATVRTNVVKLLDKRDIRHSSVDLVCFSWVEEKQDIEDTDDHEGTEDTDSHEGVKGNDDYEAIKDTEVVPNATVVTTPVTIWIGVLPNTLTSEVAFDSSNDILALLKEHDISDIDVAYRESVVRPCSGPELFAPVSDYDPLKDVIDPVTTALGLPIAGLKTLRCQGTMGFYFRTDEGLFAVTARHVLFPEDEGNLPYSYIAGPKKHVVLMGTNSFSNLLISIQGRIGTLIITTEILEKQIYAAQTMSQSRGLVAQRAERDLSAIEHQLRETRLAIEELKGFYVTIKAQWTKPKDRVIGHVVWAPPIRFMATPHSFTRDLCVIQLDKAKFTHGFKGNVLDLGPEISSAKFVNLMYPRDDMRSNFTYPPDRLLKLRGIMSAEEIRAPTSTDPDDPTVDHPRYVLKRGIATRTTIGRLSGFESHIRRYFAIGARDSTEVAICSYDTNSGPFSRGGDSGSIVANARGKYVGMFTSGAGATDSSDISFASPMYCLWDIIKAQFPGAKLYFEDE